MSERYGTEGDQKETKKTKHKTEYIIKTHSVTPASYGISLILQLMIHDYLVLRLYLNRSR